MKLLTVIKQSSRFSPLIKKGMDKERREKWWAYRASVGKWKKDGVVVSVTKRGMRSIFRSWCVASAPHRYRSQLRHSFINIIIFLAESSGIDANGLRSELYGHLKDEWRHLNCDLMTLRWIYMLSNAARMFINYCMYRSIERPFTVNWHSLLLPLKTGEKSNFHMCPSSVLNARARSKAYRKWKARYTNPLLYSYKYVYTFFSSAVSAVIYVGLLSIFGFFYVHNKRPTYPFQKYILFFIFVLPVVISPFFADKEYFPTANNENNSGNLLYYM